MVFYYLERPHDQKARINAKFRLNREIRHLTTLIHLQSKYYRPPTTAAFDAFETSTVPGTASAVSLEDGAWETESGSGNDGDSAEAFSDMHTELELDRIENTQKIEKQIFELLHRWEDAIRGYDIRATHMFTESFMIDNRWETGNITRLHLDATESRWTFSASVLFAFTVITTIGKCVVSVKHVIVEIFGTKSSA